MLRRLVIALLLAWLPVQGIAAVAMPFCRHAMHQAPVDVHAGHHHGGSGNGVGHHADHGSSTLDEVPSTASVLNCNDCGACQLACAPAAPPAALAFALPPALAGVFALDPPEPRAFVPEQPQRPPLTRG